jgi:transcriptional regulator with XRE-family HTH domain
MNMADVIRKRVAQLCAERDITVNKLAIISSLPPSSLKNIMYGKSVDPKITTIKHLCDGLNITLSEFFTTEDFNLLDRKFK